MNRVALKTRRRAPQPAEPTPAVPHRRRFPTNRRLALGLAVASLLLAAIGAHGSSQRARSTYAWPPASLSSSATPTRFWYSPLLLARGTAGEIDATIPCRGLAPPLDGSQSRTTILATMRQPVADHGLLIARAEDLLSFQVGEATFATARVPRGSSGCTPTTLEIAGNTWTLTAASGKVTHGDFGSWGAPRVAGLFSGLDLRSGAAPHISVTTLPYGARVVWWQWAAWSLAAIAAVAALGAAFGIRRTSRRAQRRNRLHTPLQLARRWRAVDGLVAVLLLTWWVVGPVFYDDGWVKARQTNGLVASGFSNYYTAYGSNLPLDFWSEWLQHWVVAHSTTILILRLPDLGLLAATWIVCRVVFTRLLDGMRSTSAEWALGVAFSLNALSWGMTLRPEPIVALLLVSVLALSLRFAEQPSGWRLATALSLVALGIATHPAGLITLAPLLAVGPQVIAWARDRWLDLGVVAAAAGTFLIVVITVGSTAQQRAGEGRLIRTSGDATASWRDEITRYTFTGAEGTTLRRASLALMIAALVAYFARRRNGSRLDIAGASLALALVLLVPTPSKWSWHFGALIGLAALAVGAEVARLRRDGRELSWPIRAAAANGVAVLIVGWALFPREDWSTGFGLRTLNWTFGFEQHVTLVRLSLIAFAVLFAFVLLVNVLRHGLEGVLRAPWTLVPLLVPLISLPLILWTIGMFVADTVKTPGWTLTRQNIESLRGDAGCGLADDTVVADPNSIRVLPPIADGRAPAPPRWLAKLNSPSPLTYSLLQRRNETRLELPWFRVPPGKRAGFYVLNGVEPGDTVQARWGQATGKRVRPSAWRETATPEFDLLGHRKSIPWPFVTQGMLPLKPGAASAVQLSLSSYARPPHALASSGAVGYSPITLTELLRRPGARPLVWPNLVLYMPCAHLPRVRNGVVQSPTLLVAHSDLIAVERPTAPFNGLPDLYRFRDLGVADSKVDPNGLTVLWVDRRIPGAAFAPALPAQS